MEVKKCKAVQEGEVPEIWMGAGAKLSVIYPLGTNTKIFFCQGIFNDEHAQWTSVEVVTNPKFYSNRCPKGFDVPMGDQSMFLGRYCDVENTSMASESESPGFQVPIYFQLFDLVWLT